MTQPPRTPRSRLSYAERMERQAAKMEKKTPEQVEAYAYNLAVWHLAQRPLSRAQLADKLARKLVPEDVAQTTLDRLTESHAIDDVDYAESFARSAMMGKRLSRSATVRELHKRGIDPDIAEHAVAVIEEERGDSGEWDAAVQIAERKARASRSLDDPAKIRRRVMNAVVAKGYSFEIASRAADLAIATLDR